jgi:uncharacterized damage-inducible protein DinB
MRRRAFIAGGATVSTFAQDDKAAVDLKVDPSLLAAHIEFIAWATRRDLDIIRKLKPEQVTRELVSSFPSILGTLQHLYQFNVSWFNRMKGELVDSNKITIPQTFVELDAQWQKLFDEMTRWAKSRTRDQWAASIPAKFQLPFGRR